MGTGKISWPDKLIVLPFSAVRPAPQQEVDKGEPGALHSNTRHHITRHYWFIYTPRHRTKMQSYGKRARTHTHTQSHLHSILYVAGTRSSITAGISDTYTIKKAFHDRLSVIFNTSVKVKGTHNLKSAPIWSSLSSFFSHDAIVSLASGSIRSPQGR